MLCGAYPKSESLPDKWALFAALVENGRWGREYASATSQDYIGATA